MVAGSSRKKTYGRPYGRDEACGRPYDQINQRPTYDRQGTASLWPLEQQQAAMYDQGYDQQRCMQITVVLIISYATSIIIIVLHS